MMLAFALILPALIVMGCFKCLCAWTRWGDGR